jgi:hypothetical protein
MYGNTRLMVDDHRVGCLFFSISVRFGSRQSLCKGSPHCRVVDQFLLAPELEFHYDCVWFAPSGMNRYSHNSSQRTQFSIASSVDSVIFDRAAKDLGCLENALDKV